MRLDVDIGNVPGTTVNRQRNRQLKSP
jgi:hypothetical protein